MIYCVVGPTASGKTKLANNLAKHFSCSLINCDAFQIYKDMDIGTGKICKSDPLYIRYSLLDVVEPTKSFSVKEYQSLCREELDKIDYKKDNVIIVGGTGLYLRAVLYDYVFPDEENQHKDYSSYTNEELFTMLSNVDSEASKTIHVNNRKRLIRALEISETSVLKSDIISSQKHEIVYDKNYVKIIFINPIREVLYEQINNRVDNMFQAGLVDEVKGLLEKYSLSSTAAQGIGYKEVISYLKNDISYENCVDLVKKRSRNYAKRQVTFFKHQFETTEVKDADEGYEVCVNGR